LASDRKKAETAIRRAEEAILDSLKNDPTKRVYQRLEEVVSLLSSIERSRDFHSVPRVLITGEIYVRRDEFSRKQLEEYFAEHGIMTHISPVHEWIYYTDYLYMRKFTSPDDQPVERFKKFLEVVAKKHVEWKVKKVFERTGFYHPVYVNMKRVIEAAEPYLNPRLTGEAIITVGTILHHIVKDYHGIVAIGPFGCMPTRIAEAVTQRALEESARRLLISLGLNDHVGDLPVVYIETDGNPFTPVIENRLEAFVVRVKRLSRILNELTRRNENMIGA
ncbi:2-hydroxyglutaryl-CoA dehydratase, partial [Methanosarcinales archaeon]